MKILGVRVDNFSKKEILEKIEFFLTEKAFHQIVTVNPEFVVEAQKNQTFKNILKGSALSVADGVGISYAFLRFGKVLKQRITGVALLSEILKIANQKKITVFLAIKKDGLSSFEEIKFALSKIYPALKIVGNDYDLSQHDHTKKDDQLPMTDCCILFCNFGAPFQEKFIFTQKSANIRLAMGVGGAFDFITKKTHRAPMILQQIGLEWLWRMILQPRRWRRIISAVIIFPVKIIFSKKQHERFE
ncbi:MAG: WecB/TagA/CpsF family glycosyltransferase [bacterium]